MQKFVIALTLTLLSFPVKAISPTVNQLEKDTRSLKSDLSTLQGRLDAIKTKLEVLEQRLEIPEHLAHDLENLDKSMVTVGNLAKVAQVVPAIKGQAEALKEGIDVTEPPVKESKVAMEKLAKAIEPIKKAVQKAIAELKKTEDKISEFRLKKITPFYSDVTKVQACVDQAEPKHHTCMQGKLDKLAKPADKVVATGDKATKDIIAVIDKIESFSSEIETHLKGLEGFIDIVGDLEHDLHLLISPLVDLEGLLKKHFTVKFPYPNPKNIFKKKWFEIKLSGKEIMKGIKHIEHEIKKMLKGYLYKAAKIFGLEKLAKGLWNAFDHPFKLIMKKLHLKIDVKIPGIEKIKGISLKIQNPLKNLELELGKLNIDLKVPQLVKPGLTPCGVVSKGCK